MTDYIDSSVILKDETESIKDFKIQENLIECTGYNKKEENF